MMTMTFIILIFFNGKSVVSTGLRTISDSILFYFIMNWNENFQKEEKRTENFQWNVALIDHMNEKLHGVTFARWTFFGNPKNEWSSFSLSDSKCNKKMSLERWSLASRKKLLKWEVVRLFGLLCLAASCLQ